MKSSNKNLVLVLKELQKESESDLTIKIVYEKKKKSPIMSMQINCVIQKQKTILDVSFLISDNINLLESLIAGIIRLKEVVIEKKEK